MIQQRLREWILHPERLSEESLLWLRGVVERFPYFQTARLLYLKNLHLLKSADFLPELHRSAVYLADLSMLFYLIEGDDAFFGIEREKESGMNQEVGKDRTLDLIDRFLTAYPEPGDNGWQSSVETETAYASLLHDQAESGEVVVPMKGQDLIDRFIENVEEGKGRSALEHEAESLGEPLEKGQERELDEDCFTETLAKIYVKQQRYEKALEIIKKLNLKYPKKSIYFADQIRFLEKLIINAKTK